MISSLVEDNVHRSYTVTHVAFSEIGRPPVLCSIVFDKVEHHIVFRVCEVGKGVVQAIVRYKSARRVVKVVFQW